MDAHGGMTNVRKHIVLLSLIGLIAGGCGRSREISGQMFIVRGDRETVKLSLQDIVIISEDEATNRIVSVANEVRLKLAASSNDLVKATQALDQAQKRYDACIVRVAKSAIREAEDLRKAEDDGRRYDDGRSIFEMARSQSDAKESRVRSQNDAKEARTDGEEARNDAEDAVKNIKQYKEQLLAIGRQVAYWSSARPYFEAQWTNVIAKTTSDADGGFKIKAPKGCWLASIGSRKVPSGEELYGWIIPADQEKILISDRNMLETPDSVQRNTP